MSKRSYEQMPDLAAIRRAHTLLSTAKALLSHANEDRAAAAVRHAMRTTQAQITKRTRDRDLH